MICIRYMICIKRSGQSVKGCGEACLQRGHPATPGAGRGASARRSIALVSLVGARLLRPTTVMADSEFEEFHHIFNRHPQNVNSSTPFYS